MQPRTTVFLAAVSIAPLAFAEPITLANDAWSIAIEPASFSTTATSAGTGEVALAEGVAPRDVAELKHGQTSVSWRWPTDGIDVVVRLDGPRLKVTFRADRPGELTWPTLAPASPRRGFMVPTFEGFYVASRDATLAAFLGGEPLSAVNGLSMPFWGVDLGDRTLVYSLDDAFHTELAFKPVDGNLGVAATHEFVSFDDRKTYGVTIELCGAGPTAPAKAYRRLLIERGQFVSLRQKIEKTPDVAKLLGAPHIYLWGPGTLARGDVHDFRRFAAALNGDSPIARQVLAALDGPTAATVKAMPAKEFVDRYEQGLLIDAINAQLSTGTLKRADFVDAFQAHLRPEAEWGDGVSTKMIDALQAAKIDRAWLGASDWSSLTNHPAAIAKAVASGYLIGPYDSYHSIHAPGQQPTWETAQFSQDLFDRGGIARADGVMRKGFQQKGKLFSPLVARPAVEERVDRLMKVWQCNSWFVDCDATGEVFDDHARGSTQADDAAARLSRLNWIAEAHRAVVGSEGGHAYAAPAIAFSHGIMTPVIGWGDPDLTKDKASPYHLGTWFPADGPAVFFKSVPMKPTYAAIFNDPKTRLPLYQTVFHDSVVATHQWGYGSLKFDDPAGTRQLLESLYNVAPLYHLNLQEWAKRKGEITRHYAFFSPIHREAALLPMTDFRWLSEDRLVQQTTFGDGAIVLTANFGPADARGVPARTIVATWKDGRTLSLKCGE